MGMIQDFAQGAEDLRRIAGWAVSKERLRQITEAEANEVSAARAQGVVPPSWSADQAVVGSSRRTRVYVGVDGVMVRTVTQDEKDKRRRQHAVRRQQRGRKGIGNTKPLPTTLKRQPHRKLKYVCFTVLGHTPLWATSEAMLFLKIPLKMLLIF